MTMQVERVEEFAITAETEALAGALLHQSFPTYPASRSYFKLRPHFRYLVWSNRLLVGHMGVDHRVIGVGDSVSTAFGVIDLCIAPPFRRRGLASQLLKLLETLAHGTERDAIMLFADDPRLYLALGYQQVDVVCTWMMVHEHQTRGITSRPPDGCVLVKPIKLSTWPAGSVDMLGYMY